MRLSLLNIILHDVCVHFSFSLIITLNTLLHCSCTNYSSLLKLMLSWDIGHRSLDHGEGQ